MKFSTIKTDRRGEHLRQWDATKFFERIQTDTPNRLIQKLRHETTPDRVRQFRCYDEVPQVVAAAELCRQTNGATGIAHFNGLVVLEVRQLMGQQDCDDVKRAALTMPSTLAAFVGATGTEVILLVSVSRSDGTLPLLETEVEDFYSLAYHRLAAVYDSLLPKRTTRITPTLRHAFLMPLDSCPLVNLAAAPFRISPSDIATPTYDEADDHLLALPEERHFEEADMTAYANYERAYDQALAQVNKRLPAVSQNSNEWYKHFVTAMATAFCGMGWPEEEAVCHLWRHLTYKDWPGLTEEFVRMLVMTVYDEQRVLHKKPSALADEPLMQQLIRRMESRYVFRRNTIMGYTEYRTNHSWVTPWRPVTEQVVNTFSTDLQLAGLDVWDRDVRRYVNSTRIHEYNPVEHYLYGLASQWDGRDHIRSLAATVPTDHPQLWADWFHTWFLAMVAQWQGRDLRYGNALVPLLVSEQGMHKSAFCRSLLPPELRSWGYTDNLSLSDERQVHLAMAQTLLINLDEFNRISPAKQQGFLKNILQLPSVKVKRPYARHAEETPRLASFIATTNMADVLTDPTGSRRFLGVQVTGNIDVSQTPNHAQLFAQAQAELNAGTRYWFDDAETAAIMQHNRRFLQQTSAEMFFHQYFQTPQPDADGQWMSATAILVILKQRAGSVFKVPAANAFGRILHCLPNLCHRRSNSGSEFYVRLRE